MIELFGMIMSSESRDTVRAIGERLQTTIAQVLATIIVLAIFGGLGFLVYRNRIEPGPLIFFAGLIAGYLSHVIAGRI